MTAHAAPLGIAGFLGGCYPTGAPCGGAERGAATGRATIHMATTSLRFVVIGAGRLGASLALALRAKGASLLGFTAHSAAGRARAENWLGGRAFAHTPDVVSLTPELYLVAVPDQALPEVAAELGALLAAQLKPDAPPSPVPTPADVPLGAGRPVVAHTSGATSVSVLEPCERAGASTLVFHPLQAFSDPANGCERFAGAAIAITPSELGQGTRAASLGFTLAGMLGALPFLLADNRRQLYHAAATFACNYLVTLQYHAERLFVKSGLPAEDALSLFLPLVEATLDNVQAQGPVKALTGPLSRGDSKTIAAHLAALATDAPHLLPAYRALGVATLDLVRSRGDIDVTVLAELAALLGSPDQPAQAI